MTDKLELKSSHEVVYTVDVADVESIFHCKPTDPDILSVLMKDGKRLYCDEVCPVEYLQEKPVSIWHDANEKPIKGKIILVVQDNGFPFVCDVRNDIGYVSLSFDHSNKTKIDGKDKWAYIDDLLNLDNFCQSYKNLQEEPLSEDLEDALAREWKGYNDRGAATVDALEDNTQELAFAKGFYLGAKWQEQQFEKNRLAAYERQTEKEADIERDFVMSIIDNEHRQPTFDDAIKYGMTLQKEQMKEALRTEYEKGRYDALEEMKKEAVEVPVCMSEDMPAVAFGLPETDLKEGDTIKIIVWKNKR